MTVDIKKKYRTRSGLDVTDLSLVGYPSSCGFPIRGIVKKGEEIVRTSWTSEGRYGLAGENDLDLIEVVESTDVSMGKEYQTRDGEKVRIYCTDGGGKYPVHGAIWNVNTEEWLSFQWTIEGTFGTDTDFDLVEVKPRIKREFWVNIYKESRTQFLFKTREEADQAMNDRVACVKVLIDCKEGDGLQCN